MVLKEHLNKSVEKHMSTSESSKRVFQEPSTNSSTHRPNPPLKLKVSFPKLLLLMFLPITRPAAAAVTTKSASHCPAS